MIAEPAPLRSKRRGKRYAYRPDDDAKPARGFRQGDTSYRQGRKRTVGLQHATAHRENAGRQRL